MPDESSGTHNPWPFSRKARGREIAIEVPLPLIAEFDRDILRFRELAPAPPPKWKRGRECLILTGGEDGGKLAACHDVCVLPAAVTYTMSSTGPCARSHFRQERRLGSVPRGVVRGQASHFDPAPGVVRSPQPVPDEGPLALPRNWRQYVQSVEDGGGVGGAAALGVARNPVWRGVVAGAYREASRPGVHAACSRSAAKTSNRQGRIRSPCTLTDTQ